MGEGLALVAVINCTGCAVISIVWRGVGGIVTAALAMDVTVVAIDCPSMSS